MEWTTDILKQYGLAGVVIFALGFVLRTLGNKVLDDSRAKDVLIAAKDAQIQHINEARISDMRQSRDQLLDTVKAVHETVDEVRELTGGWSRPKL